MFFFEYSSSNQSLYSDEHSSYISTNIANRVAIFEECHIKNDTTKYYRIAILDEKHKMLRIQLLPDRVYS